MHLYILKINC